MVKDKYCGEVYLELTFWSNVRFCALNDSLSTRSRHICRKKSPRRKPLHDPRPCIPSMVVLVHSSLRIQGMSQRHCGQDRVVQEALLLEANRLLCTTDTVAVQCRVLSRTRFDRPVPSRN